MYFFKKVVDKHHVQHFFISHVTVTQRAEVRDGTA